jgi:prolyl-tRNA synthetase
MKDMYSFDATEDEALETYNAVLEAYNWFFDQIGLPFVSV